MWLAIFSSVLIFFIRGSKLILKYFSRSMWLTSFYLFLLLFLSFFFLKLFFSGLLKRHFKQAQNLQSFVVKIRELYT